MNGRWFNMKKRLMKKYGITETGAMNLIKSSIASFWQYLTYMLPLMLIMFFSKSLHEGKNLNLPAYLMISVLIFMVMYYVTNKQYIKSYSATYRESEALRIELVETIKKLPLSYFSKHNLTDISQTVMTDVANIEQAMSHAICSAYGWLGYFALIGLMLIMGSPVLGMCIVIPVVVALIILFRSKQDQVKSNAKYYNQLRENSQKFQEAFELQQEIKSNNLQDKVRQSVTRTLQETEKIHIRTEFKTNISSSLLATLPQFSMALVILVGLSMLLNGSLSLIYYIGYIISAAKIADSFTGALDYLLMIIYYQNSFNKVSELRSEDIQTGADVTLKNYDVEFKNVNFGYDKSNQIIHDISFIARQGEVTAIVGPSGCGKSTVLKLLSKLYDYDDGEIFIGGKDISKISADSLYKNVSMVFQDVDLFDDTIFKNIKSGRSNATDEEVYRAGKLANVDEIVSNLPDGYETYIGENGSNLSGGERQRISIARAILKNAPIILLDEIAASLDVENELKIQEGLNTLIKNKTVIIVSHRLKSIENADQIIVMNNGKIDSFGKHEKLMSQSDIYRIMIDKSRLTEAFIY